MQMNSSGRVKNPIKGKVFGADTFKITTRQAEKLKLQGIEYDDNVEGTGYRVLKVDDGTGETRIVAADDASAKALSDMNLKGFDTDDVKYNAEATSFKNLYDSNADFYNGYNKGSLTWRGAIANWFGALTAKFLDSNNLTRNMFQDFRKKVAAAEGGNTRTVAQEIMSQRANEIEEGGMKTVGVAEEEEVDEDGNVIKTAKPVENDESGSKLQRDNLKTESGVSAKLLVISGNVQEGANVDCTMMNVIGAISVLVTAGKALQIINLTTA